MKRSVSLLCAVTFAAGTAVACTPKPVTADPTVDSIIEAMESGEPLGEYFDKSAEVDDVFSSTYEGLQAESVDYFFLSTLEKILTVLHQNLQKL